MEQKINVAKLLKNCPSGMELDCMMYDNLYFDSLNADYNGTINCYTLIDGIKNSINFSKYGTFNSHKGAKCVIFPKGKTTWEGFQRPFNDGDVVSAIISGKLWYGIYKKEFDNVLYCHVSYSTVTKSIYQHSNVCSINSISEMHFATAEEKEKLFKAIKDNGYKWDKETKTLKKLVKPRFKIGDVIKADNPFYDYKIIKITDTHYTLETIPNAIIHNAEIWEDKYWKLIPNKFDISTLKPFESRVLVRAVNRRWVTAFYGHYDKESSLHYCVVGGLWYEQCIPYEGNEHLLNTTDDCDDFYKNW